MNKVKVFIALSFIVSFLVACNTSKHKINQVDNQLDAMEQDESAIRDEDWKILDSKIAELEQHIKDNRQDYTDEQLHEIGQLEGRYARLALKKGIKDFRQGLQDLTKLTKGFIEGFTETDSLNIQE
jgi:ribosomal protein S15P/S13E